MSLGLWPEAVPFDPNSGTASHDLRQHFDDASLPAAVLLVCSRDLRGAAWPAQAAIGLARALASGARSVVLADLDFERPTLHERLGASNSEGVADALLFGASLERVTSQPPGEQFGFVAPGAVAPEPAELMASPAWTRMLGELVAGKKLLLAYAPLGAPGLDELAERIPAVVLLAEEIDVAGTAAMLPDTIRVEGVIRPASEVQPDPPVPPPTEGMAAGPEEGSARTEADPAGPQSDTAAVPAKEEARQALKAELEARQLAAEGEEPAPAVQEAAPSPAPAAAAVASRKAARPPVWRRALPWAGFIALAIAAGIVGGRLLAGPGDAAAPVGGPEGQSASEPAGELLGYSVAIESYDQIAAAVERADSLQLAVPDLLFYVAPVEIDETTFYRVLAGPMTDSVTASVAMQQLFQMGLKIAASEFDVRSTPLAFLVGQYEFRGDAEARMTELEAQDVPTYLIEVPYTQGPPRFHVYAGAYSGPTEAAPMRARLRRAGIADTLVLRVGRSQR